MSEFLKGTSVLVSLPTLLYVGAARRKNRLELLSTLEGTMSVKLENFLSIPYEFLPLAISFVYGLAYKTASHDTEEDAPKIQKVVLVGALTGLFLSLVGRFGMGLPTKMFGMPPSKEHKVHIVATVLYMAIFVYVWYLMQFK